MRSIPVVGWDASDEEWLAARRKGISATDVSALLGFSPYVTPWRVWAEKVDAKRPEIVVSDAMQLGTLMEPWLLEQAGRLLGEPVARTGDRLYCHIEHPWRLASPDGRVRGRLVEGKTAGLYGWGAPEGWTDTQVPLGYEFQCRWQMHVLDEDEVVVVALVAGMGLRTYHITRDLGVELEMVRQVDAWRQRHIVAGEEPPLGAGDADTLALLYPRPTLDSIDLDDTDAADLVAAYRQQHELEVRAKKAKADIAAQVKALLGHHERGLIGTRTAVTWSARKGNVDWPAMLRDLADEHGFTAPDPEGYRKDPTRTFDVKETF